MHETIMVVDDEKNIRSLFKDILELEKYNVITAASGKSCLEKLKKQKVDLILLDIRMPEMSGIETLKEIRKLYPNMKVVIITCMEDEKTEEKAMNLIVDGYVRKPVGKKLLLEIVGRVLGGAL